MCGHTSSFNRVSEGIREKTLPMLVAALVTLSGSFTSALALPDDRPAWSGGNGAAAVDPQNRRGGNVTYSQMPFTPALGVSRQALDDGAPPRSGYQDDGGAVSGNFQIAIPVVSLPGRGLNLNLVLYYNSLVWSTIAGKRVFNADSDWPVPGWSLGFGKLSSVVLIDADGTRHPLTQVDGTHRRTFDATLIDIED